EFVTSLLGRGNIEIHQLDLEHPQLEQFGPAGAVFCAGLLYHLVEPWHLIRAVSAVSRQFFLCTHYAQEATTEVDGHEGLWFGEGGYDDTLSGLSPRSFWLARDSLIACLHDAGF